MSYNGRGSPPPSTGGGGLPYLEGDPHRVAPTRNATFLGRMGISSSINPGQAWGNRGLSPPSTQSDKRRGRRKVDGLFQRGFSQYEYMNRGSDSGWPWRWEKGEFLKTYKAVVGDRGNGVLRVFTEINNLYTEFGLQAGALESPFVPSGLSLNLSVSTWNKNPAQV
jgi:hypothetical protein